MHANIDEIIRDATYQLLRNGVKAEIPNLPGAWAIGKDNDDALRNLRKVLQTRLEIQQRYDKLFREGQGRAQESFFQ